MELQEYWKPPLRSSLFAGPGQGSLLFRRTMRGRVLQHRRRRRAGCYLSFFRFFFGSIAAGAVVTGAAWAGRPSRTATAAFLRASPTSTAAARSSLPPSAHSSGYSFRAFGNNDISRASRRRRDPLRGGTSPAATTTRRASLSSSLSLTAHPDGSSPLPTAPSLSDADTAAAAAATAPASLMSWDGLRDAADSTEVGAALRREAELRAQGHGSPHVQSTLRLFRSEEEPKITLYRDHAGW